MIRILLVAALLVPSLFANEPAITNLAPFSSNIVFNRGGMSSQYLYFPQWLNTYDYQIDTLIEHDGALWWAKTDPARGNEPGVSALWEKITDQTGGGGSTVTAGTVDPTGGSSGDFYIQINSSSVVQSLWRNASGTWTEYTVPAGGGTVETSSPVSGNGTSGDPVTIASDAITRDSLSSDITDTLDRADNVPFALTYRINESATAVDGQSTYWIGNISEAHLDMTVHAFQVETLVPTGQDRTYRGTLVPLTQVSATSYTADSNPLQVVIREPGRTFGTQAVITGNGTQRTLEVQASGREFHVNEGGYFFLGVGISNAIDETYVLAASGSTEEDHADHTGFSFDVMTYVAKGSNNEGSRTQLSGTEFFNSAATAIRMEVHYDAAPGGLQDGVTTSVVCTGNDLVLGRSQGLVNLTAPGACQSGGGSTVTTSAPVSGDGSAGDPVTISDGAIDADALGIDSVNTAEIAGSAVRNAELANNAVSSAKIADGAVTLGKLGNGAVATNHIVDGSVTSAKIADATIANADMANNSIDGSNLRPNSVGSSEIEAGAVGTSELDNDSVTVSKMDSGSSTDGFVATADGSGGVAYESVPEAEVEITTELRYEINGPYSDTLAMITVSGNWVGQAYCTNTDITVHRAEFGYRKIVTTDGRELFPRFLHLTRNSASDFSIDGDAVEGRIRIETDSGTVTSYANSWFLNSTLTNGREFGIDIPDQEVSSGNCFAFATYDARGTEDDGQYWVGMTGTITEEAHAGDDEFPFNPFQFAAKIAFTGTTPGSSDNIFHNNTDAFQMHVSYSVHPAGLCQIDDDDTQAYIGPCHLNFEGSGVSVSENTITISGGGGGTVSTSAPVSGDGSSSDPVTVADGAIDTDALADGSVTLAKLDSGGTAAFRNTGTATGEVPILGIGGILSLGVIPNLTANQLADNSVGSSEIQGNAVGSSEIANNAVDSAELINNAVTQDKIADGAVTVAKMNSASSADGTIATADGSGGVAFEAAGGGGTVSTSSPVSGDGSSGDPVTIANGAINNVALANNAVNSSKVANGTLLDDDISSLGGAVGLVMVAVGQNRTEWGQVGGAGISNDSIPAGKMNSGSAARGHALSADGSSGARWENDNRYNIPVPVSALPTEADAVDNQLYYILEDTLAWESATIALAADNDNLRDLAVDTNGDWLSLDQADRAVYRSTDDGATWQAAIVLPVTVAVPTGIAVDADGDWIIVDSSNDQIHVSDDDGATVGSGIALHADSDSPTAVAVDKETGNWLVPDSVDFLIYVSTDEGSTWETAGIAIAADNRDIEGMSTTVEGDWLLVDRDDDGIYHSSNKGVTWSAPRSLDAANDFAGGIAVDTDGRWLVSDVNDEVIYRTTAIPYLPGALTRKNTGDGYTRLLAGMGSTAIQAIEFAGLAEVETNTPVSGDGTAADPVTIAADAITSDQIGSGSAADGQILRADGSGGTDFETATQQVRNDLPAPTSACERQLAYDANTHDVEICVNTPHQQDAATGTWGFIPTRTDLLVEESRAFVDSPDLNDYVFDAGAHHFYQWSIVFQSGTTRNAWVQTIATNALADSRSNTSYAVRFLGEQNSDAEALALVHPLTASTDYFYVAGDSIRTLDLSSYVAAGATVDHWEWRPVVDNRRRVTTLFEDTTPASMLTDNVPRTVTLSQAPNTACDLSFRVVRLTNRVEVLPRVFSSDWLDLTVVTDFPDGGEPVINAMVFKFAGRGSSHSEFSHANTYVWRSSSNSMSLSYSFGQHGNEIGAHQMLIREICH